MTLYFDKEGKPITVEQWVAKGEKYRRIGTATTATGYFVSTVWLGLDHDGMIFETMAQRLSDEEWVYQRRYATLAEAKAGHKAAVELWEHPSQDAVARLRGDEA